MIRILTRLALFSAVLAVVGCGRKPTETASAKPEAPTTTPKEVVQGMYEAALAGDNEKVLACFDKATAAASKELGELSKAAGQKGPAPSMMFNVPGVTVGGETVDGDKATVVLAISGKPRPVDLVMENGEWKVTMPAFVKQVEKKLKLSKAAKGSK